MPGRDQRLGIWHSGYILGHADLIAGWMRWDDVLYIAMAGRPVFIVVEDRAGGLPPTIDPA